MYMPTKAHDVHTLEGTVHPQLSEPLWSGGYSDKWIVQITQIIQNASINNTTMHYALSVFSTSMNTVSVKKQESYKWLKYRSLYKMATIL